MDIDLKINLKLSKELSSLVRKHGTDLMQDAANFASEYIARKTQPWGFKNPEGKMIRRDISKVIGTTKSAYYAALKIDQKKARAMAYLLANGKNWSAKASRRKRKKGSQSISPIRRAHLLAREMGLTIIPGTGVPESNYFNQRVNGRIPSNSKRVFIDDKIGIGMFWYHRKKKAGLIKSGWVGPWRRKAKWWLSKLGNNGEFIVEEKKVVLINKIKYASDFTPSDVISTGYNKGISYAIKKWASADIEKNVLKPDI